MRVKEKIGVVDIQIRGVVNGQNSRLSRIEIWQWSDGTASIDLTAVTKEEAKEFLTALSVMEWH